MAMDPNVPTHVGFGTCDECEKSDEPIYWYKRKRLCGKCVNKEEKV